jgi:hypothetical protein
MAIISTASGRKIMEHEIEQLENGVDKNATDEEKAQIQLKTHRKSGRTLGNL